MKNFLQIKLNEEIDGYPWQRTTSAESEILMSPVLVSRARFMKEQWPVKTLNSEQTACGRLNTSRLPSRL